MRRDRVVIVMILLLSLVATISYALPPLPTEFYGNITYRNNPISSGTITAYDSNNVLCGSFAITQNGLFGLLTCKGDDPYTLADEGPVDDEILKFYLNSTEVGVVGDDTYNQYSYKEIDLRYYVCGDAFCENKFESCTSCENDCGKCPDPNATIIPPNTTTTVPDGGTTTDGGGSAAGGGAASGAGAGGGASGGGGAGNTGKIINITVCEEEWYCQDWGICHMNKTQSRICQDINNCNTTEKMPEIVEDCIYEGTCSDNIKNGLEEGIDCGGLCELCPWDTELPTCEDGKRNCQDGVCEEGVDCGGPCDKKCERKKPILELPIEICEREFQYNDSTYWLFLFFMIVAISSDIYRSQRKINKLRKSENVEDILRATTIVHTKRNMYVFITIIMFITFMLLGYYHYFSQCTPSFAIDFLWMMIIIMIIAPLVGFLIIHILEYNEKDKIVMMSRYFEDHHSQLAQVIKMHNDYLIEIENEISNEIYQLLNDESLKNELDDYPELKEAYKEMITLYDEYKVNTKPFEVEKDLCENMYNLINNVHFVELTKKFPKIQNLYDNLVMLFKQYEEKQKLYDEEKKQAAKEQGKVEGKIEKETAGKEETVKTETVLSEEVDK